MSISLFFRATVKQTEEYYIENLNSLFGKIGGLVGMILGVSFMNIINLCNQGIDICAKMLKK